MRYMCHYCHTMSLLLGKQCRGRFYRRGSSQTLVVDSVTSRSGRFADQHCHRHHRERGSACHFGRGHSDSLGLVISANAACFFAIVCIAFIGLQLQLAGRIDIAESLMDLPKPFCRRRLVASCPRDTPAAANLSPSLRHGHPALCPSKAARLYTACFFAIVCQYMRTSNHKNVGRG